MWLTGIPTISPELVSTVKTSSGSNMKPIHLIVILVTVFILITTTLVLLDSRKKRLWDGSSGYRAKKKYIDRILPPIYNFLMHFVLTRNFVEKMAYRYRFISPCDTEVIARKTVFACLLFGGASALTFGSVFLFHPMIITLISVFLAIRFINSEIVGNMAKIFEINVLQEIQQLISAVVHNFYVEYRVDDAIHRSRDSLSINMRNASDQIYQLLLCDDKQKEDEFRKYYENVPNKYLRQFVSQCVGVMERGNLEVKGKLLFITNLEHLHRELEIEIDKLKRIWMEFLGVMLLVISPVFAMDYVKRFAISMKENMESFYYGKEGFLLDIGILMITTCIYEILKKSSEYHSFHQATNSWLYLVDRIPFIKWAMNNYCDKNASKMERLKRELRNNGNNLLPRHFVLRSFIFAGIVFILGNGITIYLHDHSREQLLKVQVSEVSALTSAAKKDQYEVMMKLIDKYTKRYVVNIKEDPSINVPATYEEMLEVIKQENAFRNQLVNQAISEEIMRRVKVYQKEHYSVFDMIICIILCMVAFYLPKLILRYTAVVAKDTMEDEVNQFNALITMLMYIDSMTVKQILEELESFAVVFRESLRICLNDFGSGDMEALNALKEREPYAKFVRIVENLIRCDEMPIYQAFHENDVEWEGYMTKRKFANEKSNKKRVMRAYLLTAVPLFILFAYCIVPPLMSSLKEINTMLKEMQNASW